MQQPREQPQDAITRLSEPEKIGQDRWKIELQDAYQNTEFSHDQWSDLIVGIGENLSTLSKLRPTIDFWRDVLPSLKKPLLDVPEHIRGYFLTHVVAAQEGKGSIYKPDDLFRTSGNIYCAYLGGMDEESVEEFEERVENVQSYALEMDQNKIGHECISIAPRHEELYKEAILLRKRGNSYQVLMKSPIIGEESAETPLRKQILLTDFDLNLNDASSLYSALKSKVKDENNKKIGDLIDELGLGLNKSAFPALLTCDIRSM